MNNRIASLEAALPDPDKLEQIAAWLDTYDKLAESYLYMIDLLHKHGLLSSLGLANLAIEKETYRITLEVVQGTEVQDDLRRWAKTIREVQ